MKKEKGLESVSCVDKTSKLSTQVTASENKDAKRDQWRQRLALEKILAKLIEKKTKILSMQH